MSLRGDTGQEAVVAEVRSEAGVKDRGVLKVSARSWHGRVYLRWKDRAQFKKSSYYRENLCHYVRVIVLWAPVNWFFKRLWWADAIERNDLPPVTCPAGFAVVAGAVGWYVGYWVVAAHHALIGTLKVLGMFAGVALVTGFAALVVTIIDWQQTRRRGQPTDEHAGNVLVRFVVAKKHRVCPLIEIDD